MRFSSWILAFVLLLSMSAGVALARAGAPPGSYTATCKDIIVQGGSIDAICQTASGRWQPTALPRYRSCDGDITNDNGNLRCSKGAGGALPEGSYRDSCTLIVPTGSTLNALCRNAAGSFVPASLGGYGHCHGEIQNNDGQLQCVHVPDGSYQATCNSIVVAQGVLTANCQTANGRWQQTTLERYRGCRGDIQNENGNLTCRR
jgi:hypothetical protein